MTDRTVGDTLYKMFTTRALSGVPTSLLGTPVVAAYEDASITQITAGITLGVDHDGVTGLNLLTIVATGANGFESGKDYNLVITTGTVNSVTAVGETVAEFSLSLSAAAKDLANGTDGLGAIKADTAAILVDTGTTLDTKLNTIDTNVDSILVDTAEIGAAGAGLTNLGGMSTAMRDEVRKGGYDDGQVFIDTLNGVAGTTDFVNGTSSNHVDLIASAKTIAASVGLHDFHVGNGSTITLGESTVNENYRGHNWNLNFNSKTITGSYFEGAFIQGLSSGQDGIFKDCEVSNVTVLTGAHFDFCSLINTITLAGGNAVYTLHACHSQGPNAAIDFGTGTSTTVNCHHFAGELELKRLGVAATDIMNLDGFGKITLNADCTGGTLNLRGGWEVIDNSGGSVTINFDDNTSDIQATLVDTTEIGVAGAGLTDLGGMSTGMKGEVNAECDTAIADAALATAANLAIVDGNVDSILADTGTDGVVLSAATQTSIADTLLNRDMSAVTDSNSRTLLNAARILRNKWSIAATTMTVTKEDDSTTAWTATVSTDASADPVIGTDPV